MGYRWSGKGEGDSGIGITGTGTIVGNNEALLKEQVEVEGSPGARAGGGRLEAGDEASDSEAKEPGTSSFNVQFNRYCQSLKETSIRLLLRVWIDFIQRPYY